MAKTFKTGDLLPAITKQITQERIAGWAELSGDFNRLHVDPAYARETRFGGTIAHGEYMGVIRVAHGQVRHHEADLIHNGQAFHEFVGLPIREDDF